MINFFTSAYQNEPILVKKARFLAISMLVTFTASTANLILNVWIDYPTGIYVCSFINFCHFIFFALLRYRSSLVLIGNLFCLMTVIAFIPTIMTSGGVSSAVVAWFITTKVSAFWYADKKSGYFWAGVSLLSIFIIYIIQLSGYEFGYQYPEKYKHLFAGFMHIGVLGYYILVVFVYEKWNEEAKKIIQHKVQEVENKNEKLAYQQAEISERNHELEEKNVEIQQQNEELFTITEQLQEKNETLVQQKHIIEIAHQKITASINYAERIQKAILPRHEQIASMIPEYFIFFQPRDVVSGDFYWCSYVNLEQPKVVFATADCTGHGVPGAFMSMAGANLLEQIVNDYKIVDPAEILGALHQGIRSLLRQEENQNQDGMDISMSVIDWNAKSLAYAGAKRPLCYVQNNQICQVKGDIYPIGGFLRNAKRKFQTHQLSFMQEPIIAYTFSDGYPDQVGGKQGRKFMIHRFRTMLSKIANQPMSYQKNYVTETFNSWKGKHRQLDDILVVGMRLR